MNETKDQTKPQSCLTDNLELAIVFYFLAVQNQRSVFKVKL